MSEKKNRRGVLLEMELESVYRFPVLEIVAALVLFVTMASSIGGMMFYTLYIGRTPAWNGTLPAQQVADFGFNAPYLSMTALFQGLVHPLAIVVPIVVAISIAGCMEDNTLKTLLSYPIKRSILLGTKILMAALIPSLLALSGILFSIAFFVPAGVPPEDTFLLLAATAVYILLLVSFGTIAAILFRRVSVAAVGGVGFWYVLQLVFTMGAAQQGFLLALNPLGVAASSLTGLGGMPSFNEIPLYLMVSIGIALLILSFSFILFERLEV